MAPSRWSVRVATVAGIEIRVHATFLVLVALVALGSTAPEGPGLVPGLLWLVSLFSCVVVHELAHSVVARRHGIPIIEIELLPIGGVSKMERSPDDPRVDLRIAAAGPAASVALAVAFACVALLAGVSLWPPTLAGRGLLARLAWVNLLLAGFNLLPALPLDGGRVLRALLERRTDRQRATQIAAQAGRVFGSLMIVAGFLASFWLLVIGVFVYFGSWAEETSAAIHERIKDLRVRDVMIRDPIVLPASAPASRVAEVMWLSAQREFPVVGAADAYVGMVAARALVEAQPGTSVGQLALPTRALDPDEALESSGLLSGDVAAAAVVGAGHVVGLALASDAALVVQRRVGQTPSASRSVA